MIINFPNRNQVMRHVDEGSIRFEDPADGGDDEDFTADDAEIVRMIEFSGMIGLECGVLEGA